MRKILLVFSVAFLGVILAAGPAGAITLEADEYLGKFKDVSDIFIDDDGTFATPSVVDPAGLDAIPPGPGDEQRTLTQLTNLFDSSGSVVFDTSSPTQLTGLLYDLEVAAVGAVPSGTGFILDFVPQGRNPLTTDVDLDSTGPDGAYGTADDPLDPVTGAPITFGGVLEIWEEAKAAPGYIPYTQDPGGVGRWDSALPASPSVPHGGPASGEAPYFWTEGASGVGHAGPAGADTFPGATEGTYWLAANFVDLNYLVNIGVVGAPVVPFAPGTVVREFIDLSTGSGSGFAYGNIVGGAAAPSFLRGLAGPLADISILFDLNTPIADLGADGLPGTADDTIKDTVVYQGLGHWAVDSEDPVVFAIVPEPASLSLLSIGLLGLVGLRSKKRKS
jgi:hypothetical protein